MRSMQVVDYEYKVLLSRGFDLEAVHPTEHISAFLVLTGAPLQVRACCALCLPLCRPPSFVDSLPPARAVFAVFSSPLLTFFR